MMPMILEVKNLTKTFKNLTVVNDISFCVQEGEVFGLLGPNGAGKSTSISMITGVLAPDDGKINLEGKEMRFNLDWAKKRIGYVPQELAIYPTLSAYDNLSFFGQIYGLTGTELKVRIQEVLEIVQLSDRANDIIDHFSGGMKRRVNLAVGLLHKPRILFLDEPTVGVDPQSRNAIFESLETLNREGLTIFYTTHYMEEAERLCNRVAIMDSGRIVALDTPANLINRLGDGMIQLEFLDENVDMVGKKIRELNSVRKVTQRGKQLEISSKSFEQTIIEALQIATSFNTRISGLNLLEANLETVFLNLTGKSIRE